MENMLKIFGSDSKTRVENAIEELQVGKGVLLIDNEDRENEDDLIVFTLKHDLMVYL